MWLKIPIKIIKNSINKNRYNRTPNKNNWSNISYNKPYIIEQR